MQALNVFMLTEFKGKGKLILGEWSFWACTNSGGGGQKEVPERRWQVGVEAVGCHSRNQWNFFETFFSFVIYRWGKHVKFLGKS